MGQSNSGVSRRSLFVGAGTAGALAAAVRLIPAAPVAGTPAALALKPDPERGGGYTLSAHVKQYYKTTLV